MLWFYVLALVFAGGVLALQLVFGHDSSADAEVGLDAPGAPDAVHGHDVADAGLWPMVTSVRFWTFALLAFGVFGTLATLLGGSSPLVAVIAALSGIASGFLASWVVRRLSASSGSHVVSEAVGKLGRVLVALDAARAGKVRVELRGEMHDLLARADEPITVGESVVVLAIEGGVATVTKAPKELRLGP